MQNKNNDQNNRSRNIHSDAYPEMRGKMVCDHCYPDVYYRVQPYVMSVCDQIDSDDGIILSREMLDQISDNIYNSILNDYPDLADYACCNKWESNVEGLQRDFDRDRRDRDFDRDRRDRDFDRDRRGRDRRDRFFFPYYRFRRRGIFRDFIDLLLLNELLRRGRLIF